MNLGQYLGLIGTLVVLVGALFTWQTRTLRAEFRSEIAGVRTELEKLRADISGQIASLREELHVGLAEIRVTLEDHEQRLTRLEGNG